MSEKKTTFRSKIGKHTIKKGGTKVKFHNFLCRTDDPKVVAMLRSMAAEPNSSITELKQGEKVIVEIRRETPAEKPVDPKVLDVPEVKPEDSAPSSDPLRKLAEKAKQKAEKE